MTKRLKLTVFLFAIATLLFNTSCLRHEDEERTEETEKTEITNFLLLLLETGSDIDTTASAIYYITHKTGSGENPKAGDTCSDEYVGYFIDGSIFETSVNHYTGGIRELIYKETEIIEGFEEAIGMLKTGTEATFIIPSKLTYGSVWNDFIPPYTPLVYDINMHDLKPKSE